MKSHTKIFLFTTLDAWWSKIFTYTIVNKVNALCLIIKKINRYIEECSENISLTLLHTDESKDNKKVWGTVAKNQRPC